MKTERIRKEENENKEGREIKIRETTWERTKTREACEDEKSRIRQRKKKEKKKNNYY